MSAGQLRNRVVLQAQSATQDALGQPSTEWVPVASLWADIRHVSGMETIKGGADTSTVKASIRLRHRAFTAGQRIAHGLVNYDIKAVLPDPKREYTTLVCEVNNAVS